MSHFVGPETARTFMRRRRPGASFMTRLGRDARGNTIALAAAAMIPLAGLIGGGVDMSRLYLVKTRLQQACDAGALAGRKTMGSGSWTTGGTTSSQARANELFAANFKSGAYGTSGLASAFTENDGVVSGTASVTIPMTIMKVFGMTTRSLAVACTAKMEIPNTDVMFVLDVTGSMNCNIGDAYCSNNGNVPATNAKIKGLKSAVKCFYEALLRVNTAEVCGGDPTASSYTGTAQIRIGFVPYSVNVNVGKLLHNDYFADSWAYQSREPNLETVQAWSLGAESALSSWSSWSATSMPASYNTASGFGGSWSTPGSNQTVDGVTYSRKRTGFNSTTCPGLNTLSGSSGTLVARTDIPQSTSSNLTGTTNNPPTHPASSQTLTYTESEPHTITGYRYRWKTVSGSTSCWLELNTDSAVYSRTRTATSTKAITWTEHARFLNWTYRQVTHTVSGLKAGGSTWNATTSLPIGTTTGPTVKLSGSNTDTALVLPANSTVTWDGCIEERATVQNSDYDPTDEWSPIPAAALDLDIDMIPSSGTAGSKWGPMLDEAVWARYESGNNTVADVVTASDLSRNYTYYCTTEAKKLQTWYTPTAYVSYVDSFAAIGNTYHDIGMIWGARFISPTGLFASENAQTPTGGAIQRHIIFMTDGDTMTSTNNLSAYGIHWWDRRQTSYAPSSGNLNSILDSRLTALCAAIRNRNITLWVVSYGGGINATTEARLQACATPGNYFSATDTATLIDNFKQIASEIAELRLTS